MTKHAPKPWVMVGPRGKGFNRNYGICHESPGHVGGEFATVRTLHQIPEAHATQDANAHLIAAAPEILETLEALMEFWDNGHPVHAGALLVNETRELIAKAKGGTP